MAFPPPNGMGPLFREFEAGVRIHTPSDADGCIGRAITLLRRLFRLTPTKRSNIQQGSVLFSLLILLLLHVLSNGEGKACVYPGVSSG